MRVLAVVVLLALCSSAFTAELLHKDSKDVIPNQYIVVLKNSVDRAAHIAALKENILANDDELVHEEVTDDFSIHTDFQGFFATLGDSKLGQQLAHPDVEYIETNKIVRISYSTETGATWGLARSSRRDLPAGTTFYYNATASGKGIVDCYIVDTGILSTHVDFGGRVTLAYNAITGESPEDLNGHGTHVAGTVAGKTYGFHKTCPLFAIKVLGKDGSGTNAGVIKGIEYVSQKQKAGRRSVANMSLGGPKSTATDAAVNSAVSSGVAFAVAAGNDNKDACNYSPAAAKSAVTVGATTNQDVRSSFSNWGTCVDIFAPGSSITSDWIGSNTATNTISGTSMASPHVCGVLALHREVVADTPAQLSTWIIATSTSNKVTSPGTGSPNKLLYSPY